MATITRFEDLEIWQLARTFCKDVFEVYTHSDLFLKDYKLKDQINGASGSVMDNIAEGFERSGRNEFINFLSIAKGSCGEVKSQLHRAMDRLYLTKEQFDNLYNQADQLAKKIGAFISYLNIPALRATSLKTA